MQAALAIVEEPLVPVIVMTCALDIKTVATTMSNYVPVSEFIVEDTLPLVPVIVITCVLHMEIAALTILSVKLSCVSMLRAAAVNNGRHSMVGSRPPPDMAVRGQARYEEAP